MPRVCRIVKTLPISAVSLPFSSSIMNRRPVPEVRASSFCVTPRPLRVSRASLPMSCGVYFKSLTSFNQVTVREYYSVFWAKINTIFPYGNIDDPYPPRRPKCSRTGTKHAHRLHFFLISFGICYNDTMHETHAIVFAFDQYLTERRLQVDAVVIG